MGQRLASGLGQERYDDDDEKQADDGEAYAPAAVIRLPKRKSGSARGLCLTRKRRCSPLFMEPKRDSCVFERRVPRARPLSLPPGSDVLPRDQCENQIASGEEGQE